MNFAIIGVGGYIARKHLKAIKETGNNLIAAVDVNDSVGILDSFFPECIFFTEMNKFLYHINGEVDYISICTPNYLHFKHCIDAMCAGANVICEKPLVINPTELNILKRLAMDKKKSINVILQLRLHPSVEDLKTEAGNNEVNLRYITPRGQWYDVSWKGNKCKSGGVLMNIGIHMFDLLLYLYGDMKEHADTVICKKTASGTLFLEKANVKWYLSTCYEKETNRMLQVNGVPHWFDDNFNNLHTLSYEKIINGEGFTINDTKKSIALIKDLYKGSIQDI